MGNSSGKDKPSAEAAAAARKVMKVYQDGYPEAVDDAALHLNADFYTNGAVYTYNGRPVSLELIVRQLRADPATLFKAEGQWWPVFAFPTRDPLVPVNGSKDITHPLQLHEVATITKHSTALLSFKQALEITLLSWGFFSSLLRAEPKIDLHNTVFEKHSKSAAEHPLTPRHISRVLKSMGELGMEAVKPQFVLALIKAVYTNSRWGKLRESLFLYWVPTLRNAFARDDALSLIEKWELHLEKKGPAPLFPADGAWVKVGVYAGKGPAKSGASATASNAAKPGVAVAATDEPATAQITRDDGEESGIQIETAPVVVPVGADPTRMPPALTGATVAPLDTSVVRIFFNEPDQSSGVERVPSKCLANAIIVVLRGTFDFECDGRVRRMVARLERDTSLKADFGSDSLVDAVARAAKHLKGKPCTILYLVPPDAVINVGTVPLGDMLDAAFTAAALPQDQMSRLELCAVSPAFLAAALRRPPATSVTLLQDYIVCRRPAPTSFSKAKPLLLLN